VKRPSDAPAARPRLLLGGRRIDLERFILDYGQALREEMAYRRAAGLRLANLLNANKTLLEAPGKAPHLGMLGYAQRVLSVSTMISRSKKPLRILDAGCGYGTESILFSLLGADVLGVELVADRTALAASRVEFYQRYFRRPMRLRFINANLFRFLAQSRPFDVIWTMEAISHIHPAEDYFSLARSRLKPGGRLVISDANALNPRSLLGGMMLRGKVKHAPLRRFSDPATGSPVDYAEERRFTAPGMIERLKTAGFRIEKVEMCGFMGTSVLPRWLVRQPAPAHFLHTCQRILQKTPVLRYLGSIYTIIAA
jgi:SAM-dependent methyltransferase